MNSKKELHLSNGMIIYISEEIAKTITKAIFDENQRIPSQKTEKFNFYDVEKGEYLSIKLSDVVMITDNRNYIDTSKGFKRPGKEDMM